MSQYELICRKGELRCRFIIAGANMRPSGVEAGAYLFHIAIQVPEFQSHPIAVY